MDALWVGDNLTFHPHLHILMTDGVYLPDAGFYGYLDWDAGELTSLLRDSILTSFTCLGLLSQEAADTMLSWPIERSGFNIHVETRVESDDRERLESRTRCAGTRISHAPPGRPQKDPLRGGHRTGPIPHS